MVTDEMRAAFADSASRLSAHLIDLVVRGPHGRKVVEIFIDAEKGVTSELCSEMSREASLLIDRSGWIQGSYRLDVSSPGIGRPLAFPWQYSKHVGRILAVRIRGPQGAVVQNGRLVSVGEKGIVIEPEKGGAPAEVSFADMEEAVVRSPW